jgi:hypothetical protein
MYKKAHLIKINLINTLFFYCLFIKKAFLLSIRHLNRGEKREKLSFWKFWSHRKNQKISVDEVRFRQIKKP